MVQYKKIFLKVIRNLLNETIDRTFSTSYSSYVHNKYILNNHNNSYTFPKELVCLIHVPKTGGTSVKKILRSDNRYYIRENHDPISLKCNPFEGYLYASVIRDPIDRAYSYYMMNLRDHKQPYHHAAKKGLENFIEHCWEMRNIYTRYYSGIIDKDVNAELYELAKENIKKFYKIIKFDNLDSEIEYLIEAENTNQFQKIPHENKVSYPSISSSERNLIISSNLFDIELYKLI